MACEFFGLGSDLYDVCKVHFPDSCPYNERKRITNSLNQLWTANLFNTIIAASQLFRLTTLFASFSEYKESPNRMKENYLLSVLMGDIVGSPKLCHQLAKRGRACADSTLSD